MAGVIVMDVKTYLEDWLSLRRADLRPRTIESYEDLISRLVVPAIGSIGVADLAPDHVRHLLAAIVATGHTRTAELVYVMLKCAFADLEPTPMRKVKRPRHKAKRPEAWSDDQMVIYLEACKTARRGLALSLALLLGLRRGEICGLKWEAVDLDAGYLHIRNQRVALRGGVVIDAPPKSDAGFRSIPLPPQLAQRLREARGLPSAYLCPLTPSGLDQAHRALTRSLDLPYIPLHGLRHTMASSAIRHGGDMRALQYLLGHAHYSTTADVYTHPNVDMLKTSIDAAVRPCYTVMQRVIEV